MCTLHLMVVRVHSFHVNAWFLMSPSVDVNVACEVNWAVIKQNSWHRMSTYTSLSPYQLNTMPFHWRRVGNESNISISLQLSHTCYLEYPTGQVQDWVNTSYTWLSMQEHQWNKRTHLLAAHFALLFSCIIIVHLHSLVPRPFPAFRHLQYEKAGYGKLDRAWEWG